MMATTTMGPTTAPAIQALLAGLRDGEEDGLVLVWALRGVDVVVVWVEDRPFE